MSDTTLRHRAHRAGLRLITHSPCSRWFAEYGPYALADAATNALIAYGLDAEGVAAELDG